MNWNKISSNKLSNEEKQQIKDVVDSFGNENLSDLFNFNSDGTLRFGTWGRIGRITRERVSVEDINNKLEPLNFRLIEMDDYDDDRGWLYYYGIETNLSDADRENISKAEQEKGADSKYDAYKKYTTERWAKLAGINESYNVGDKVELDPNYFKSYIFPEGTTGEIININKSDYADDTPVYDIRIKNVDSTGDEYDMLIGIDSEGIK